MMLRSSNPNHIQPLSQWGKANGILRLNKFLPQATAFYEIVVIDKLEDLISFLPNLPKNYFYRRDSHIGSTFSTRVSKDGNQNNIVDYFKRMKETSSHLALLIIFSKVENLPRYISNGGFNVAIKQNEEIIIEFVGKGFDAKELTNGICVHETFSIPWDSVLFCDSAAKLEKFKTFSASQSEYNQSKNYREKYLNKIGHENQEYAPHLPQECGFVSNFVKEEILNKIVFPLYVEMLTNNTCFNNHWVCGNISHKDEIAPFEFSSIERIN